jgi:hypothetical protein
MGAMKVLVTLMRSLQTMLVMGRPQVAVVRCISNETPTTERPITSPLVNCTPPDLGNPPWHCPEVSGSDAAYQPIPSFCWNCLPPEGECAPFPTTPGRNGKRKKKKTSRGGFCVLEDRYVSRAGMEWVQYGLYAIRDQSSALWPAMTRTGEQRFQPGSCRSDRCIFCKPTRAACDVRCTPSK